MPQMAWGSESGHEFDPVLSQDLDRSWANPVESKKLSLAGSVEVGDRAISGGLEGSRGWTAHCRR